MRFFRGLLAPFIACLIVGAAIWFVQLPDTPTEAPLRDLERLMNKMVESSITGAKPGDEIETDWDRFEGMSFGNLRADTGLLAQYRLEEMAERLTRMDMAKLAMPEAEIRPTLDLGVIRVYLIRGHSLCQQGKSAEGREWFLRALAFARMRANQHAVFSCRHEYAIIRSLGSYASIWSEDERRAFLRRFHELPAQPGVREILTRNGVHPALKGALEELPALPRDERLARAKKICAGSGRSSNLLADLCVFTSYLISAEELEAETVALTRRLEPLTAASIQAVDRRSDEAHETIQAEAARLRQFITQARPQSPQELRNLLAGKEDPLNFIKSIYAAATDEEVAEALNTDNLPMSKKEQELLAKHPTPLDPGKKAEYVYIGIIHRGAAEYRDLLGLKIVTRCLELAMETGAQPTAGQVAAIEGRYGETLLLGRAHNGQRAILQRSKGDSSAQDDPLLILDPIK
jgi:hypothetical protein